MSEIFFSVIPVLSLFIIGYLLQKIHFFKEESIQDFKRLVVSIALPCLLFRAFSQLELQSKFVVIVVIVFVVCLFMVFLGKWLAKIFHIPSPYFPILMGGFETGMLGYAIFISVYGIQELDKLAIIDLGQVIFVFFVLMALLIKLRDGTQRSTQLLKMFFTSPVIIAIFLGIIMSIVKNSFNWSSNQLFEALNQLVVLLGNLTVPVICLVIGYELCIDFNAIRLSIKTIIIRKLLLIILALSLNKIILVHLLQLPPIYERALLTMFILPPPFVIALFLRENDTENQQYVVNTLSLSTLVSILVFLVLTLLYA